MAEQLTVSIIGCGVKGAFGPVSHAEAFQKAGFKIAGFWDVNPEKSEQAAVKWGGVAYNNKAHAFQNPVDVVCVAVPDDQHAQVLEGLIDKPFRLLFAEKPFTRNYQQARELAFDLKFAGLEFGQGRSIAVNYTRRYSPMFQELQGLIRDGEFGDFLGGSGFFGNGLYHSGSHMIDLLRMLVGDIKVPFSGRSFIDANHEDPSLFGVIEVTGSPFYLGVIPRPCVNAFEATLYFTQAAVSITDIGREFQIRRTVPRYDYPGDKIYGNDEAFVDLRSPMRVAAQNIADHLNHGTPLLCTDYDAIEVLRICSELAEEAVAI